MPNYAQAPVLVNKKPKLKGNFIQIDSDVLTYVCKAMGRKAQAVVLFIWLAGQSDGFRIPYKTVCDALNMTKNSYYRCRAELAEAGIITVDNNKIEINYSKMKGTQNKYPILPKSSMGTQNEYPILDSEQMKGTQNKYPIFSENNLKGTQNETPILKGTQNEYPIFPDEQKIGYTKPGMGTQNEYPIFPENNLKGTQNEYPILDEKLKGTQNEYPKGTQNVEYNIEEHRINIEGISSVEEFLKTDFIHKDDPSQKATGEELLGACDGKPERLLQVFECYPDTQKCKEYFAGVDWTAYEF